MDIGQLCSILAACISTNPEQRKAGENTLEQFQNVPGQLVNLLRVAMEDSLDVAIRQVAAITFKNATRKDWDPIEGQSPIPDSDKAAVRDNLLEGLMRAPPLVRTQLGESVKAIASKDFPEHWSGLLPALLQNLSSQDHGRLYGAVFALRILARKYEFKDEEDRGPLTGIVNSTFPVLLQLFQGLLASKSPAVEIAELQKLVLKIFWSATYMGIPALLLQEAQFVGWMTSLLEAVKQPVPQEGQPADLQDRKSWPWWKAKKWMLHISHRLFQRYGDPKLTDPNTPERAFAELWKQHCSSQFLEAHLNLLAGIPKGQYMAPRVTNLALQYITTGISLSASWKVMKPHMQSMLANVVFPLCCFDDEDEELWEEDPQEYIRKGYDVMEEMYNTKTAAMNFIQEVCKVRAKGHLADFMHILVGVMNEYKAAGGNVTKEQSRRVDGAFLAVGALNDILRSTAPYKTQLEPMLQQYVLPCFNAPAGHVRAKACWVTQQYADVKFADGRGRGATFMQLFRKTLERLNDPDLPVRVDAVAALRNLVDAFDKDDLPSIKPLIPNLLNQLFALMNEVESEDVVFALETIVENFGGEMAPFAVGLCQHLTQAFWRLQESAEDDDADDGEGLMAAYGCMRALSTVLDSVSSMSALFPELEAILFPLMQRLTSTEGQDVFEEVLELISYFTYFSPSISQRMWSLWPQIIQCFYEWAVDYFDHISGALENYICRGTEFFLAGQVPSHLQQLNEMVEKALTTMDLNDEDAGNAPHLLDVVMQNCRGHVDSYIGSYINLALKRLPSAEENLLKDKLMNVVANAIYYNPVLALQQLQQQSSLQHFFGTWFQMIFAQKKKTEGPKHFRRLCDKKINALAMAAVLTVPDEALPQEVRSGLGQLMAGLLKLLTTLKAQQRLCNKKIKALAVAVVQTMPDEALPQDVSAGPWQLMAGLLKLLTALKAQQDMLLDEDEDEEDDQEEDLLSDSEDDGEAFDADGGADEDGNLGDDEDADADGDADDAYLKRLERESRRQKGQRHDDSDSEDEWTDEEDDAEALDTADPFLYFADTLRAVQTQHPARFQALTAHMDGASQAALQGMMQHAEEVRCKPAREE